MSDWPWFEIGTLLVALVSLGISGSQWLAARRPLVAVSADFTTGRLGRNRHHPFFVVRVHNRRSRPVTIRRVEWDAGDAQFELQEWTSGGAASLPVRLGDNEEQEIVFDNDVAANALACLGARSIKAFDAGGNSWTVALDETLIELAHEDVERLQEQESEMERP